MKQTYKQKRMNRQNPKTNHKSKTKQTRVHKETQTHSQKEKKGSKIIIKRRAKKREQSNQ